MTAGKDKLLYNDHKDIVEQIELFCQTIEDKRLDLLESRRVVQAIREIIGGLSHEDCDYHLMEEP